MPELLPLSPERYYKAARRCLGKLRRAISGQQKHPMVIHGSKRRWLEARSEPLTYESLVQDIAALANDFFWLDDDQTNELRLINPDTDVAKLLSAACRVALDTGLSIEPLPRTPDGAAADSIAGMIKEIHRFSAVSFRLLDNRSSAQPIKISVERWRRTPEGHLAAPRNNAVLSRVWNYDARGIAFENGPVNLRSLLPAPHIDQVTFDVDWVYSWVDGNDPDWLELFRQYAPSVATDAADRGRFEHRDDLKYALRSLELYAPWIRNIYVVSNCKPPTWLQTEGHDSVTWVDHHELFAEDELPTFSSHAIETVLHKIPGLSEHFIYSNDDFYLARPTRPSNFFASNGICLTKLEPYGMVNGEAVTGDPDYLNAARNSASLIESDFNTWPVRLHTHSPQALRVSILDEMEERYSADFQRTRASRFRSPEDIAVTGFLFHHYAHITGRALPVDPMTRLIQQNHPFKRVFNQLLEAQRTQTTRVLSFCVNDGRGSAENAEWNTAALNFLREYFPNPSRYEK